jgi:hypothetical protein
MTDFSSLLLHSEKSLGPKAESCASTPIEGDEDFNFTLKPGHAGASAGEGFGQDFDAYRGLAWDRVHGKLLPYRPHQ